MAQHQKIEIIPILGDAPYTCPPLLPAIVAKIRGKRKDFPIAYRNIQKISQQTLSHLKRVNELVNGEFEFLLCISQNDKDLNEQIQYIKNQLIDKDLFYDYRIANIPSKAPRTHEQLKACKNVWPCKFARDDYLIKCMNGTWLADWERTEIEVVARTLINYLYTKCNSSISPVTGTVIFRNFVVRGVGFSNNTANLLHHAPMLAIDDVSKDAGAGFYKLTDGDEFKKILQNLLDDEQNLQDHRERLQFVPYLCTKYDVLVTEEPCFMCSFALIESRIRRLYYVDAKSMSCHKDKAIESFKVHLDRRFNHRFEAFRVRLMS